MSYAWKEDRDGTLKFDMPLKRGEHRPVVSPSANGTFLANGTSGYIRTFDDLDSAKRFARPDYISDRPVEKFQVNDMTNAYVAGDREDPAVVVEQAGGVVVLRGVALRRIYNILDYLDDTNDEALAFRIPA